MEQSKKMRGSERSGAAPLLIAVDRRSRLPMHRQIYVAIRDAVRSGRLAARTRLPPSRALALDLGVSRTTVVGAYEQLVAEGYIATGGSRGSVVADLRLVRPARKEVGAAAEVSRAKPVREMVALVRRSAGLAYVRTAPVAFRVGEPALDRFPVRIWTSLYSRRLRRSARWVLGYGSGAYRPLQKAIAGYVSAARGVNASADQVVLTRGTQQAIHLIAKLLVAPGDRVWVEDPGYLAARAQFQAAGAAIVPVRVDADGLVVADGVRRAPDARLACVSPSHQFPLGTTMSLARRFALIEWAVRSGGWIVEDDFASEFRYVGTPIASLQGLDAADRVLYVGTFSKTMCPALRIGYVIVPAPLVDAFTAARALGDSFAPSVEQAVLTEFIEDGHFSRHVRQMRREYAARRDALVDGVQRELGQFLAVTAPDTGMHLVARCVNTRADDAEISARAWRAGVETAPLSLYGLAERLPPALLLGFAAVHPRDMLPALRRLRDVMHYSVRRPSAP